MRVGIAYGAIAWLMIEISATVFPYLGIPDSAVTVLIILVIIGFPIALVLSWIYDLTPKGIQVSGTSDSDDSGSGEIQSNQHSALWLFVAAAIPTLLFGAATLYFFLKAKTATDELIFVTQTQFEELTEKSIAVLPLENLSPDPGNAFFAGGFHAEIITTLSKVREFVVINRGSTLKYENTTTNRKQIGNELDVNYLVEGSIRRAGNQVRVSVELIDSQTDRNIWVETYNRQLDDIFAIQADVATQIASRLKAVLSPKEIADIERRPTDNIEAYDFYLKTRGLFAGVNASGEERQNYLKKAVELDPNYSEAWAQLAIGSIFRWDTEKRRDDPDLLTQAHHAVIQAKQTGPDLPYYENAMGSIAFREHRDLEAAVRHIERAIEIEPTYSYAYYRLLAWNNYLGRTSEVERITNIALRVNPSVDEPFFGYHLRNLQSKGNWNDAEKQIEHAINVSGYPDVWRHSLAYNRYLQTGDKEVYFAEREKFSGTKEWVDKSFPSDEVVWSRNHLQNLEIIEGLDDSYFSSDFGGISFGSKNLAAALNWYVLKDQDNWKTENDKAKAHLLEVVDTHSLPAPFYWAGLAISHALDGNDLLAHEAVEKSREIAASTYWEFRQQAACEFLVSIAYLILGDKNQSLLGLESAFDMESRWFPHMHRKMDLWFIFDRLRGNPRFEALLKGEVLGPIAEEAKVDSAPEKSIAVLPFVNISNRPEDEPYTNGIHSTLLTQVSHIKDLRPTSRVSVMTYQGSSKRLTEIAEELNVRNVLTGDVQIILGGIRINVQLIEAATDSTLWAETYDEDLTAKNIFQIQNDISHEIADALKAILSPAEEQQLEKLPTQNLAALEAYYTGKAQVRSRAGIEAAAKYYEKAISLDPDFALAYVGLAKAQYSLVTRTGNSEWLILAEKNITKALELDESSSEAYTALSSVRRIQGNHEAAIEASKKALEINPNDASAYGYLGLIIGTRIGNAKEAAQHLQKRYELNPNMPNSRSILSDSLLYIGKREEAIRLLEIDAVENPTSIDARFNLGVGYRQLGRNDDAIIAFRKKLALDPTAIQIVRMIGWCYFRLGDNDTALGWHRKYAEIRSEGWEAWEKVERSIISKNDKLRKQGALEQFQINPSYGNHFEHLVDFDIADGRLTEPRVRIDQEFPEFLEPSFEVIAYNLNTAIQVARVLTRTGENSHAKQLLQKVLARLDFMHATYEHEAHRAVTYALLGDGTKVLAAIRQYFHLAGSPYELELKQELKPYFDHPEYKSMSEKRKAELAIQLERIQKMEANGELAPIPEHLKD